MKIPYWKQVLEHMAPGERYTPARLSRLTRWERGRVYQALNTAYVRREVDRAQVPSSVRGSWEYWRPA